MIETFFLDLSFDYRNISSMEPAATIIEKFGGFGATAEITGRSTLSVRRWTYGKERGGTGGLIPTDVQPLLLSAGLATGVDVSPDDFFNPELVARLKRARTQRNKVAECAR